MGEVIGMKYMQNNNNRLREVLRTPTGLGLLAILVIIVFILVFFSIRRLIDERNNNEVVAEYDPASGEYIAIDATDGGDISDIYFVGFDEAIRSGVGFGQYSVFTKSAEEYAAENNIDLSRVSYLNDSLKMPASNVFEFYMVLNIDQETLKVRIDSPNGEKNILGMMVTFWNDNNEKVFEKKVTLDNVCDYISGCENIEEDNW